MDTPRRALNGGNAPRAPCQPHVHQGVRADTNKPMSWQTSSRGRRLGTPKTNRKAQRALSGVVPVGAGRCRYLTRLTGQVHDQIFIDGMHLSGGWVLLIARDREHVLEWQWAANESAQAYTALLERLAPADVVTTDGAAGALAAIAHLWPSTRVQRCLVHVHRDIIRDLTMHPRTEPNGVTTLDEHHQRRPSQRVVDDAPRLWAHLPRMDVTAHLRRSRPCMGVKNR